MVFYDHCQHIMAIQGLHKLYSHTRSADTARVAVKTTNQLKPLISTNER